jgi:hypothetical protein
MPIPWVGFADKLAGVQAVLPPCSFVSFVVKGLGPPIPAMGYPSLGYPRLA